MIKEIYIENVAVIKKLSVSFGNGLTVITGETGAGKSILIDCVNAILGQRVTKEMIRTSEKKAVIIATFNSLSKDTLDVLKEFGIDNDDDELILQREINVSSKSTCRVNGMPCNVSTLKAIGNTLIAINGQNESYELNNKDNYISYVDSISDYHNMLSEYKNYYNKMNSLKVKLNSLNINEIEKAREVDILNYQINEIETANISLGELNSLKSKRDIVANSEKISTAINESLNILNGDYENIGAMSLLENVSMKLSSVLNFHDKISDIDTRIKNLLYELDDCSHELSSIADSIEFDANELNLIEERIDCINKLCNKYGNTEEDILNFLKDKKIRLEEISFNDEKVKELKDEYNEAKNKALSCAETISHKRIKMSNELSARVEEELKYLDMPNVSFIIERHPCEMNSTGIDLLEFLISVNAGESIKPIFKVASGGELSRIMLAIKTVVAKYCGVDTLIFDEIDTGVSGSTSQKIGLKLKEIAHNGRQVMCVTHSAQIAATSDEHLLISKNTDDNRTYTSIETLNFPGRQHELARIIGGVDVTELTLENAKEMLINNKIKE